MDECRTCLRSPTPYCIIHDPWWRTTQQWYATALFPRRISLTSRKWSNFRWLLSTRRGSWNFIPLNIVSKKQIGFNSVFKQLNSAYIHASWHRRTKKNRVAANVPIVALNWRDNVWIPEKQNYSAFLLRLSMSSILEHYTSDIDNVKRKQPPHV